MRVVATEVAPGKGKRRGKDNASFPRRSRKSVDGGSGGGATNCDRDALRPTSPFFGPRPPLPRTTPLCLASPLPPPVPMPSTWLPPGAAPFCRRVAKYLKRVTSLAYRARPQICSVRTKERRVNPCTSEALEHLRSWLWYVPWCPPSRALTRSRSRLFDSCTSECVTPACACVCARARSSECARSHRTHDVRISNLYACMHGRRCKIARTHV